MTVTDSWLNPIVSGSAMPVLGYREDLEEFPHELYSFLLSSIREEDYKYTRLVWRWLRGLQQYWEATYGKILNVPMLYSPSDCPEEALEYLRYNIGVSDDLDYIWGNLDTVEKRRFLTYFIYFLAYKATIGGIPTLISYMSGLNVRIKTFFDFRWIIGGEEELVDLETFIGRDEEGYDPWLISEAAVTIGLYPDQVEIVTEDGHDYYEFVINTFVSQVNIDNPPLPESVRVKYSPLGVSTPIIVYIDGDDYKLRASADYYFGQVIGYSTSIYDFRVSVEPDPYTYDILVVDDGTVNRDMLRALASFSRVNSERIYLRYYWVIDEFENFDYWTDEGGTVTFDETDERVTLADAVDLSIMRLADGTAVDWTEYSLSVKALNGIPDRYLEIRFAWQDEDNYYFFRVTPATPPSIPAGTWDLGYVVAGEELVLSTGVLEQFDVLINYFWRIVWVYAHSDVTVQLYQDENLLNEAEPEDGLLFDCPFTETGSEDCEDEYGWPIEELGVPRFEYRSGDGDNFRLNGVLTAFDDTTGALEEDVPTPWTGSDGQAVVGTYMAAGTKRRYTTAPVDPAAGQAVVGFILTCRESDGLISIPLSNSDYVTDGWWIRHLSSGSFLFQTISGGVTVSSAFHGASLEVGWKFAGFIHLFGTVQRAYLNGQLTDEDDVSGQLNVLGSGAPFGLNCRSDGVLARANYYGRALFWYPTVAVATAVCTDAWFARVARYVLGTLDRQADGASTFDRNAAASIPCGTRYHLIGYDGPRTCADGMFVEPERTNELRNNINPQVNTGYLRTAGAHNLVDDSANLGDDYREVGPDVHQFIPGGADAIVYSNTTVGDLDTRSSRFLIRGSVGGELADFGLRDNSTGGMTVLLNIICTTEYQEIIVEGFTPLDTDEAWALDCDAGDTIYFVAEDMQKGTKCSSVIPNISTVASATRPQDVFTSTYDPEDDYGLIEISIEPRGWSGNEWGTVDIVRLSDSLDPLIWVEGGTWRVRIDGITDFDTGIAPADGIKHRFNIRWMRTGNQSVEVYDGMLLIGDFETVYAGTLYSTGTLLIAAEAPVFVSDVEGALITFGDAFPDPWPARAKGSVEIVGQDSGIVDVTYVDIHPFPMDSDYIGP